MRRFLSFAFLLLPVALLCQTITQRLQKAWQQFESDSQLKHAISSLYVIDAKTGQVVFDKNSQTGLAPASTQKIITSVTAFELLGKNYRYKTELGYRGKIEGNTLFGDLLISGSGDPTLGSGRYYSNSEQVIIDTWLKSIQKLKIKLIVGRIGINGEPGWSNQFVPDGWIWQDIGNYYGAGANMINWRENQYDMYLKSGNNEGDSVRVISTSPKMRQVRFESEAKTGKKGSGDNAYIFLAPYSDFGIVTGTIPPGESAFRISGSVPAPGPAVIASLEDELIGHGITISSKYDTAKMLNYFSEITNLATSYSPSLDSIIYWFNKKSINLYGEALIKTFAYKKQGFGSTDSGVAILKKFWKGKGVDEEELNMYDGSGLSPLNRVTTHAQVEILKYAKTKDWFPAFYHSLPEYNGMKIKSGTISDVKGFCGYHKAKDGREYIFSFLVNNYSEKASVLVPKMYKVLDVLK